VPEKDLVEFVGRARRAVADSVDAMPLHHEFIDKHCKAPQS